MKSNIWLAGLGVLSVLGLFSCSSDNPENPWALHEPVLESKTEGFSFPVTAANLQSLPGDTKLRFRASDLWQTNLKVDSSCESRLGVTTSSRQISGASEIDVRELWPDDLWLKLTNEELVQSNCSFQFQAAHENVTHTFELKNVRVLSYVSAISLQALNQKNAVGTELEKTGASLVTASKENDQLHFICETFQNSIALTKASRDEATMKQDLVQLVDGPIELVEGIDDPRHLKPVQLCRFLKTSGEQPATHQLSQTFEHRFRPPGLKVTLTNQFAEANRENWKSLELFRLKFENDNDRAVGIALPVQFGRIKLRLVGRETFLSNGFYLGSRIMHEPVAISASKAPVQADGMLNAYEILPGETLEVVGQLQTGAQCYGDIDGDPAKYPTSRNMGVMYGYENPIQISQFRSWRSGEPNLGAELVRLPITDEFPQATAAPVRFAPSNAFLASVGDPKSLPSAIRELPADGKVVYNPKKQDPNEPKNYCWYSRFFWRIPSPFGPHFDEKQVD